MDTSVQFDVEEHRCRQVVEKTIKRWEAGERPDAPGVLSAHPEIRRYKSLVLDLIYEEYRQEIEAGRTVDRDQFCDRFPDYRSTVNRLLQVDDLLNNHGELIDACAHVVWPKVGETFAGFQLLEEVGQGAIARVFLAQESDIGDRLVVLKVTAGDLGEAGFLGRLDHPNVVPIISRPSDSARGLTAICMPFRGVVTLEDVRDGVFAMRPASVSAQAIATILRERQRKPVEAGGPAAGNPFLAKGTYVDAILYWIAKLAEGLAFAHSRGVLHRDLKPSNILISESAEPLLIDFNLAANIGEQVRRVGGTLPYMAPEQVDELLAAGAGGRRLVDERSDVFGLGAILFEMLTGQLPFPPDKTQGDTEDGLRKYRRQQSMGTSSPGALAAISNRSLLRLVESCLSENPDLRPQSARDLARALRGELRGVSRLERWSRSHRIAAALLTAAIVGGIGGSTAALLLREPYSTRLLNEGRQLIARQDYSGAVTVLGNSLDANPLEAEAMWLRGRARERLNDRIGAFDDYGKAHEASGRAWLLAAMGYCKSLQRLPDEAAYWYRKSIAGGFGTARVQSNLGHSLFISRDFRGAAAAYSRAALLDPDWYLPYHGRAKVTLREHISRGEVVAKSALDDIQRAISLAPHCAELYLDSAILWARSEKPDAEVQEHVKECLAMALNLRLEPSVLRSVRPASLRLTSDEMLRIVSQKRRFLQPIMHSPLVDPCSDGSWQESPSVER